MRGPTTGALRVLRSAVVTVVVVGLAVLAHVAGGGHLPSGPVAGAVVVVVASTVHRLTRRPLGTAALLAVLAGGQLLLHHVFMGLDAARTGPLDVAALNAVPMGRLGHLHPLALDPASAPMTSMTSLSVTSLSATSLSEGTTGLVGGVPPMLLAHAVATVLTALVLAGGERALWRWWAWVSPLVVVLLVRCRVVAVRLPRAARAAFEHRPVREAVLVRALPRRGPPAGPLPA